MRSDYYMKRKGGFISDEHVDMYLYDLGGGFEYDVRGHIIGRPFDEVYREYREFMKLQLPFEKPLSENKFYAALYDTLYIVMYDEDTHRRVRRAATHFGSHIIHDRDWLNEIDWRQEAFERGIPYNEFKANMSRYRYEDLRFVGRERQRMIWGYYDKGKPLPPELAEPVPETGPLPKHKTLNLVRGDAPSP